MTSKTTFQQCSKCKQTLPISAFYKNKSQKNGFESQCKKCESATRAYKTCTVCGMYKPHFGFGMCRKCYDAQRRHIEVPTYTQNRSCTAFLGCHVAEHVLRKVFKDVKMMPYGNKKYDFICNHGKKIDVKSACLPTVSNAKQRWLFSINYNTVADYFLCIAFDNREDLNPLHLWLIPGKTINHLTGAVISKSTVAKWNKYELDLTETVKCCTTLKSQQNV